MKKNNYPIGIYISDPSLEQQAETLAAQTGLPVATEKSHCRITLTLTRKGLSLCTPNDPRMTGTVEVDFTRPVWTRRLKRVREERLIKAMGKNRQFPARIIDATGGLGRDSFLLAAAGFHVRVFERNPILAALLADGLNRASEKEKTREICKRIRFTPGNAIDSFSSHGAVAEIVYLDPMFPKSNSLAKVKKELQMIQQVTGEDPDIENLFARALQVATGRVVVKRPKKGPWLSSLQPAYSLAGKTIRFDIYLTGNIPA